ARLPIWGTPPEAIDAAEARGHFRQGLLRAGLHAPEFGAAQTRDEARERPSRIGYPVLVRASYALARRGMEVGDDSDTLADYASRATGTGTGDGILPAPVLVDRFLDQAIEIDVDALYDGQELYLGGVMEHIEEAGIHSGDSACVLPPITLSDSMIAKIRASTEAIAAGVGVRGLINIQ